MAPDLPPNDKTENMAKFAAHPQVMIAQPPRAIARLDSVRPIILLIAYGNSIVANVAFGWNPAGTCAVTSAPKSRGFSERRQSRHLPIVCRETARDTVRLQTSGELFPVLRQHRLEAEGDGGVGEPVAEILHTKARVAASEFDLTALRDQRSEPAADVAGPLSRVFRLERRG